MFSGNTLPEEKTKKDGKRRRTHLFKDEVTFNESESYTEPP